MRPMVASLDAFRILSCRTIARRYSLPMTEFQMMLFLVGVHIFGFVAVGLLMIPALRDDDADTGEDTGNSDDGWGNRPNVKPDPSRWPGGGIPLPDADQSTVRL